VKLFAEAAARLRLTCADIYLGVDAVSDRATSGVVDGRDVLDWLETRERHADGTRLA